MLIVFIEGEVKSMNRITVIMLGIALIVFIIVVMALIYIVPMFSMHPIETGNIEGTNIIAVKNRSNNLFLMEIEDGYMLIDAGSDCKAVIKELKALSINPEQVKYIFLTHTDCDHVAALNLFVNAEILLSADEKQMVDGTTKRTIVSKNTLSKHINIESLTWINSGDKVEIKGHTVEGINAPGHTTGSMLYLVDDKYLFIGDAFKISDGEIAVHPYTMNPALAKKTIVGLDELLNRCEWIFTAHYGYVQVEKKSTDKICK